MIGAASSMALGAALPPFALRDGAGAEFDSAQIAAGKPVLVAFICNHCPFVLHLLDAFVALARQAQEQGVDVVAISSNSVAAYPEDGPGPMAALARERGFTFPYLFDETQDVARAFDAVCTPEFMLFDRRHKLAYHGQFDDSRPDVGHPKLPGYPVPRPDIPVTGKDLRAAIDAVLSSESVEALQRAGTGCSIKWKETA